jgi:nitrate/nitrite-specific signal transduction histidine kinase
MEPNTIFMWTAGAAATITSALAIRAAWTQYNAAIADANTLRFQLQRAHTLVDQMTDQVASMNRSIGELRSELKTAKAKQAVADIDVKAAKATAQASGLWLPNTKARDYNMIFTSGKVADWVAQVPKQAVKIAANNKLTTGNIHKHGSDSRHRFMVQYNKVRYCTPYFPDHRTAAIFRDQLFRSFNVTPEVYL